MPTKSVMMPRELTHENGAKGLMSGEFKESVELSCPQCSSYDEANCDYCGGSGTIMAVVTIEWTTIKEIYAMAVKHLEIKQ